MPSKIQNLKFYLLFTLSLLITFGVQGQKEYENVEKDFSFFGMVQRRQSQSSHAV